MAQDDEELPAEAGDSPEPDAEPPPSPEPFGPFFPEAEDVRRSPVREAVGTILTEAYRKSGMTRERFAKDILHEKDEEKRDGERAWTVLAGDKARNIAEERVVPDPLLVRLLVLHCVRARIEIPFVLERFIRLRKSPRPRKVRAKTLISALGLKTTKAHQSISTYSGNYLLFTLDPDSNVVVTSFTLSQELGDDGAPIYQARRKVTKTDIISFVGAYFANEHQLNLVGTPRESVELRLHIFHIIHLAKQTIIRGLNLRLSNAQIFSTRCVLVREVFGYDIRDQLLVGSLLREDMENFFRKYKFPSADDRKKEKAEEKDKRKAEDEDPHREQRREFQDMFQEIVDYLYDLEAPPVSTAPLFIKVAPKE
jgi:hypothetical protein